MTLQDAKDGMLVLLQADCDVNFKIGVQRCLALVNKVEVGAEARQLEAYKGVADDVLRIICAPDRVPDDLNPVVAVQALRDSRDELRGILQNMGKWPVMVGG